MVISSAKPAMMISHANQKASARPIRAAESPMAKG
jgi:hypothetical protein